MEPFTISILLKKEDNRNYLVTNAFKSGNYSKHPAFYVYAILVVVYFLPDWKKGLEDNLWRIAEVIGIITLMAYISIQRLRTSADYYYETAIALRHEITYSFSNTGIHVKGINFEEMHNWRHILKLTITGKKLLSIHTSSRSALYFPLTTLTEEQRAFIQKKFDQSRKN